MARERKRAKATIPSKKQLEAMHAAVSAMLAGEDGEGDWPKNVSREDLNAAQDWIGEKLYGRET